MTYDLYKIMLYSKTSFGCFNFCGILGPTNQQIYKPLDQLNFRLGKKVVKTKRS